VTPPAPPVDLLPLEVSTSPAAALFLVGVVGVGFGAVLVAVVLRYFAYRRAERRELAWLRETSEVPLSPGARRVVRGRVDVDGDDDVAIRIDVDQIVKNHTSKNSRWHTWNEIDRRIASRPFYLQLPGGEPVYVEPDPGALVVDEIESRYPLDRPRCRTRTADVRRGEMFYVYGDLARGAHPRARSAYRDGSGWVLRAPRDGRMLLATSALQHRYRDRARFVALFAILAVPVFVVFHAMFTYPYVAARLNGQVVSAELDRVWTYETTYKGRTRTHYALRIVAPGRAPEGYEVDQVTYDWAEAAAHADTPAKVPAVVSPWTSTVFLGPEPYVSPFAGIMGALLVVAASGGGLFVFFTKAPWYDRKRLNERGGSGHWVEPRPGAPVELPRRR
jgi:hypothetical protein